MAKFCVAYGLCPLIDQHSLLGVCDDSVTGCVIVTIGKNIVIRYKFQDQKQVSSWSTKDKLTSPVIYDTAGSRYAAVFNQNQLRVWTENEEQLDKVKKYKFQEPIHCIIPQSDGDTPLVLFRNGCVVPLDIAVESRKEGIHNSILKPNETITDHYLVTSGGRKLVTFVTSDTKGNVNLNVVPVVLGEQPCKHELCRSDEDVHLIGQTVVQRDDSCSLLTLWSDRKLFSYSFLSSSSAKFPGVFLQTVTAVNTKIPVTLVPLSGSHVAVFGADPSEEGAVMILLNLQFKLVQSRLHFKLYNVPPRLWNIGANLLLAVGHNLVVVPYRLETERLSTLVGSHSVTPAMTYTKWLDNCTDTDGTLENSAPQEIQNDIKALRTEGLSQAAIVQSVMPILIDKKQISSLVWCLQKFSDIPESSLTEALLFCLSLSDSTFGSTLAVNHKPLNETDELDMAVVDDDAVARTLEPSERFKLINTVLNVSFTDVCLIPHLRAVPFTVTLTLLAHLSWLLEEEGTVPKDRVLEWISLLLDAHYQQYLLSRDPQVLILLTKLKNILNLQFSCIEDLKQLAPLLRLVQAGKTPRKQTQLSNKKYSIEPLHLY